MRVVSIFFFIHLNQPLFLYPIFDYVTFSIVKPTSIITWNSFIPVLYLILLKLHVLFETKILSDRLSRALQLPLHLSKLILND